MTWTPIDEATPPMEATLAEVREWIDNHVDEGIPHCPGCHKRVKADPYRLRAGWVEVLQSMARTNEEWTSVSVHGVTNATMLRHWGLIEREEGRREDGYVSTGKYRITPLGWRFLAGQVTVPYRIVTLRGEFVRYDEDHRYSIDNVLGYHFDFDRFMRGND